MRREAAISLIDELCKDSSDFRSNTAALVAAIGPVPKETLIQALLECGVIPESFAHDSSQEKLYAKYCDVLMAQAFSMVGIKSLVIELRADSADVEGATRDYTIVGDAKAFRLSRTAKNQKDFKVTALSGWRKDKDYACLAGPFYQYPNSRSQIYTQALTYNVTLLGNVHLAFLVEYTEGGRNDLRPIWTLGKRLSPSNSASTYWQAVDEAVCQAVERDARHLATFKQRELEVLEDLKQAETKHLRLQIEAIHGLSRVEATQELVKALKLPARIRQIEGVLY